MENQQTKFKILMFPWLAHGHISPFLELGKTLPSTTFSVYLCSTRVNLDSLNPSSVQLVELHVPSSPELPPEMHTTKNLPSHLIHTLIKTFQKSSASFSEILDSVDPDLLIFDYFQPWAPKLASSKGIPSVLFSTCGATMLSFYHHGHAKGADAPFPSPAIYLLDVENVDLTDRFAKLVKGADKEEFGFGTFALSTDIVLVKTCREAEGKYIDYLSVLCEKKIVPTGPLIVDASNNDEEEEQSEIMKWLSGKKERSTVYVSFGSEYFMSKEEMAELAKGLLLVSEEVNFLWVVRFPNGETSTKTSLPEGFIERVKGRGRVIEKWAPQTKILAHASVGGFASHCGWSSVMESMYFGVPIIGMPMKFDQPLNARFMAEVGVGVVVEKDGRDGRFRGVEVARAMQKVMVEKEFSERAEGLGRRIRENADRERDAVAEELLRVCMKKMHM